jgi:hypothetical protein
MFTLVTVGPLEDREGCEESREGDAKGSDSSRTVGDIACAIFFLPEEMEDDILRSIRLARLDFLSFSSLSDVDERAVGGGENDPPISRLEVDRLLLMDRALWTPGLVACVEGGRVGDKTTEDGVGDSRVMERRRSESEARP